jgi:hypothetical protein
MRAMMGHTVVRGLALGAGLALLAAAALFALARAG